MIEYYMLENLNKSYLKMKKSKKKKEVNGNAS